jgi:hypothetical protein
MELYRIDGEVDQGLAIPVMEHGLAGANPLGISEMISNKQAGQGLSYCRAIHDRAFG